MTASELELAGLLVVSGAAAVAILATDRRLRYSAIWVALLVAPVLLAGDVWDEPRVVDLRSDPALLAASAAVAAVALAGLAVLFERYPAAFAVLAIAILPLRLPIRIGGETSELLIPLYGVIVAEAARRGYALLRGHAEPRVALPSARAAVWLLRLLAVTLMVYAIQSAYSEDVSNAIEDACFFLVPFAVLFVLLLEVEWTPRLLGAVLIAAGAAAVLFAGIALVQEATRHLTFNKDLLAANQLHRYFRVNSLFHDPNVLGRYLALAVVAFGAYIAWSPDRRWAVVAAAASVFCVAALAFTYSLTSFAALIAGLVVVAALRWGLRAGAAATAAVVVAGGVYVVVGNTESGSGCEQDIEACSEGRVDLVRGGIDLARDRPVWGWGSGSFGAAFERHIRRAKTTTSHSEPITVAAEQGAIGLIPYVALLAVALAVLLTAARTSLARCAVAAGFAAMIVHSIGYAGFAIDPATWALLAFGIGIPPDSGS